MSSDIKVMVIDDSAVVRQVVAGLLGQAPGIQVVAAVADPLLAIERMLSRVADEAARRAHLVHDRVAGIDAGRAGDALVLQAMADVDAGWADLNT